MAPGRRLIAVFVPPLSIREVTMDDAIRKGEVIGGKYRIEGVLGIGAMGIVYGAHHLQLDGRVALKVLRNELVAFPDAVRRFTQEAQAAAKIKNEHVARVFDVGELPDGTPYIVMEFLEGEDLAHWLAARGALRLEEAIAFILQACEALVEAHVLGIVHRDLKPSNLFCSRRPDGALSIKVLDFGISKIAALATTMSGQGRTSGAKATMGSPFYMSPEQMQSPHDVDHRTDIWALGVILFELLTTVVPFEGATLPEVCIKVATQPPRSLRELRRDLPPEIEATILTCLQKNPDDRFENLAEFAGSLFPFGGKGARTSIERIVQVSLKARSAAAIALKNSAPPTALDMATLRPLGATVPPPAVQSRTIAWVGLGGAAAAAVGALLFWAKPMGKADRWGAPDRAAAAGTVQASKVPSSAGKAGQIPELLPRDPEPSPLEPIGPTAPREEPHAATRPAGEQGLDEAVPLLKPDATVEGAGDPKQRRLPEHAGNAVDKARRGGPATTSSAAPGTDLRRERAPQHQRDIDERNPYAP